MGFDSLRFNKGMGYLLRHVFITFFVVALLGTYFYQRHQTILNDELSAIIDHQTENISDVDRHFSRIIQTAAQDLSIIAGLPTLSNFLDSKAKQTTEAEQMFIHALKSFVQIREYYDQLRLLDMKGMDLVRVNWGSKGPLVVPREKLQDKSTRTYFLEAKKLKDDQVYFSELDLNIENGKVEIPHNPVIRLARRVKSPGGREAILVINIFGQKLLHSFVEKAEKLPGRFFLVNELGYYLHNPDETKEWSQYYEYKYNIAKDFSQETWEKMIGPMVKSFGRPEGLWVTREVSNPLVDPNYPNHKIRALFLLDQETLVKLREPILKEELNKFTVISILIILGSAFIYRLMIQRRKLLQKEIEAQAHIQNLSKLASLGTLAAGISHEINNPLAIIRAMAIMLKDKMPMQDAVAEKLFRHQDEAIERVATIVRGLKSLTGPKVDLVQNFPIGEVLHDMCELSKLRAKQSRITIDCHFLDGDTLVMGDRAQLHQVIMGLITNAFDAIPEDKNGTVILEGHLDLDRYKVVIRDNGIGISEKNIEKIFDPFFSTKPVGKGVGIGLSFAQAYIRAIGGEIRVNSEIGKGSAFTIELPRFQQEEKL